MLAGAGLVRLDYCFLHVGGSLSDKSSSNTHLYAQALREALDSVVAPEVRDEVIQRALRAEGLDSPPVHQGAFLDFVRRPVHASLERVVGKKTALAAVNEVHRLMGIHDDFADGSSEIRRISELSVPPVRTGSSGPVKREKSDQRGAKRLAQHEARHTMPVSQGLPPAVLIATTDVSTSQQLAACLEGIASVQALDDLFLLMEEVHNAKDRSLVVIIDGQMSPISAATIAALGPELPEHAHVLLWRTSLVSKEQAHVLWSKSKDWLRIPEDHTVDQIAELCDCLLDAGPGSL